MRGHREADVSDAVTRTRHRAPGLRARDGCREGQAKPMVRLALAAAGFDPAEGSVEQAGQLLRRDPRAAVADDHAHFGCHVATTIYRATDSRAGLDAHLHGGARLGKARGVSQQVGQRVFHQQFVHVHGGITHHVQPQAGRAEPRRRGPCWTETACR